MKRSRRVLEAFLSGCGVYVLMAACSSTTMVTATSVGGTGGAGGHVGHGGTMGMGGVGGDSGIMDALLDPVPSAEAGVENPQSGTRLKGKFMMGSDGSKEYQLEENAYPSTGPRIGVHSVWYDSMLMADCSYYLSTDGTVRCLPGHLGYYVYYADNLCTQPVVAVPNPKFGCTTPPTEAYAQFFIPSVASSQCVGLFVEPIHVAKLGGQPFQGHCFTPTSAKRRAVET